MAEIPNIQSLGVEQATSSDLLGIDSVIQQIAEYIVTEYREYFEASGINATYSLSQSMQVGVSINGTNAQIQIGANKYFDFIDEGVNGIDVGRGSPYSFKNLVVPKSMLDGFKKWLSAKSIPIPKGLDSTAYALAVGTKIKGIEPKHIQEKLITDELIDRVSDVVGQALERAVDLYFAQIEKDNGNNNN